MTETMPHDDTAERYVLSAAIQSAGRTLAIGELRPEDFHDPRHERLFAVLQRRIDAGDPIEGTALLQVMLDIPGLDSSWLVNLLAIPAVAANVSYYTETILAKATARAIVKAGERVAEQAGQLDDAADLLEAANDACEAITTAATRASIASGDLTDEISVVLAELDQPDRFTPTPWPDLDRGIGGWRPGCLYVLGARPGTGKSLVGVCAALRAAGRQHRTFFASVEMTKNELYLRMLANVGRVDHARLLAKTLDDDDWSRVVQASDAIAGLPLHVADDLTRPAEIIARARGIIRDKGPLGLLVVDYMQLMQAANSKIRNRQEEIAEFSRALKIAAKQLHVPVLALAQLNRNVEGRSSGKPRMSDLRESGALEQDADVVILLHRDEDLPDILSLTVAKNRHGTTGTIDLYFHGRYQRIESMASRELRAV